MKLTPNYIRAELIKRGIKSTDLATDQKVTPQFISNVIHGHKANLRIRQAIAEAIGRPVHEIWPDKNNKEAA